MIKLGGPKRSRALGASLGALCLAMLAVGGCGSNGTAGLTFPPSPKPEALVKGVVQLPYGVLAATQSPWQWAARLHLFSPAYASPDQCNYPVCNPNVFPASGVRVTLERVDHADAADGVIDNPVPLAQSSDTDESGGYTINANSTVPAIEGCGYMAYVGGADQQTLTRAFILTSAAADTEVDVVSETVVRVVLDRLTKAPPVQLCDFPLGSPGLQGITDAVATAVFTATGTNVEEMNQSGFEKAMANQGVKQAIDQATGVPVAD